MKKIPPHKATKNQEPVTFIEKESSVQETDPETPEWQIIPDYPEDEIYKIKNYITKDHKHLLWKDEINDDFLITKWGEIFIYSKTELKLYVWSYKKYSQMKESGVILSEDPSDDPFYTFNVKLSLLPELLLGSGFKNRPHIHGKWIRAQEVRLAHRIIRYEPELGDEPKIDPAKGIAD